MSANRSRLRDGRPGLSSGTVDRGSDRQLLLALRRGDEWAFETLVDRHQAAMIRLATSYVRDPAAAADVVQETWVALLEGLGRFEGRCSLKTWLFRVLFNKSQSRAAADRRLIPFSAFEREADGTDPWADQEAITPSGRSDAAVGMGSAHAWRTDPERILENSEASRLVREAIDELPRSQRTVVLLRDVEGFSSRDVCDALQITPSNQRVLLHRARKGVRKALTDRFSSPGQPGFVIEEHVA